jgi:hypothetical protein
MSEEKEFFTITAKKLQESMEFISKDSGFLARRLKKTNYDKEPDKFKSNCAF